MEEGDKEKCRDLRGGNDGRRWAGKLEKREPSVCVTFSLKARRPTRLQQQLSLPRTYRQSQQAAQAAAAAASRRL